MKLGRALLEGDLRQKIAANRVRRSVAHVEKAEAREELRGLLAAARQLDPPLTVAELCRLTGMARKNVYVLLNGRPYDKTGGSA